MHLKDFLAIIKKGENEAVEFKEHFCDEVIETLTAMANSTGGQVYLGISDKGKMLGTQLGKESIQKWLNEIKHKTDFKIIPDIEEVKIKTKKLIVFSIPEYPNKPISFRGRYYKRVSSSNHLLTIEEISDIYLKTRNRSWDMFIDEKARLKDLDFDKVNKVISKINENRDIKIANDPLAFLRKYDLIFGEEITNAALLLFSVKPLFYCEIQIGLFQTDTTIKKSVTIKTDLLSEVDLVMDFIMSHITKEYIITGKPQRDERWQYPLSAVREFIVNAIIHRDYRSGVHSQFRVYQNKLVIWNVGKLPTNISIEDLYAGSEKSTPRNLKIAEIFKEIGLIEKYGSGVKRAIDEIVAYKLPKPEIKEVSGGIDVNIFGESIPEKSSEKSSEKNSEKSSEKILHLLQKDGKLSAEDIADKIGISSRAIEKNITNLKKAGLLKRIGPDKGGYWKVLKSS
jgi:ATP-dependent DNA helicase RecG